MRAMNPEHHGQDWFARNRDRLAGHGLYLDGGEPGRPDPADFARAGVRLLLCRLSTYEDVRPSITHRMLFWAARQVPGVYVDLAFLPPRSDLELLERDGVPWWLASGCKRSPAEFDIVAISVSAQQETLNLPAALRGSGLRPAFAERMADPRHPLILLGGHAAGSVPFLHGDVSGPGSGGFVDAVCVGDGIAWLQELLRRFDPSKPKKSFLRELARKLPGTYAPSLCRHAVRGARLTLEADAALPLPVRHREDPPESWTGGYDGGFIPFSDDDAEEILPLSFGCSFRCRFCQTGWERRTLTETGLDDLHGAALRLKRATAASDLNLLASDACSVDGLSEIVSSLLDVFPRVSVKSLSVASLARRGDLMRLLAQIDKREFTFGVEGISPRLRAWLGKSVDVRSLVELVLGLVPGGLRQLKLFFIATGLETEGDLDAFGRLLDRIRKVAPACRLITSFTPLFNAPFTPLQFEAMHDVTPDLAWKLETAAKHSGAEFRWSARPAEIRLMNLLCRAGRRATPALARLSLHDGVRYYDNIPDSCLARAEELLRESGIELSELEDAFGEKEVLPWDDLEAGAKRRALWLSRKKALENLDSEDEEEFIPEPASARPRRPAPPRPRPVRHYRWTALEPGDAFRPAATVARGRLRELFRDRPDLAAAYAGEPQLLRPAGAYGLAILSAEFAGAIQWPDPIDAVHPDRIVHVVESAPGSARELEERLKAANVPFQSVRRGDDLWSVVKKGYRNKTGLIAFCRRETAPDVILCSAAAEIPAGGHATAILEMAPSKCPKCGAQEMKLLHSSGASDVPTCPDCLLTA